MVACLWLAGSLVLFYLAWLYPHGLGLIFFYFWLYLASVWILFVILSLIVLFLGAHCGSMVYGAIVGTVYRGGMLAV